MATWAAALFSKRSAKTPQFSRERAQRAQRNETKAKPDTNNPSSNAFSRQAWLCALCDLSRPIHFEERVRYVAALFWCVKSNCGGSREFMASFAVCVSAASFLSQASTAPVLWVKGMAAPGETGLTSPTTKPINETPIMNSSLKPLARRLLQSACALLAVLQLTGCSTLNDPAFAEAFSQGLNQAAQNMSQPYNAFQVPNYQAQQQQAADVARQLDYAIKRVNQEIAVRNYNQTGRYAR